MRINETASRTMDLKRKNITRRLRSRQNDTQTHTYTQDTINKRIVTESELVVNADAEHKDECTELGAIDFSIAIV